ncbi:hypothetical protein GCK32_008193 [Trichostrongylus colubriformis]
MNTTRIPVYLSHLPAGTSSLNLLHWIQMVKTGSVAMLDLGEKRNLATYGQKIPPSYEFRNISTIPIYLFAGGNDILANNQDINGFLLPRIGSSVQLNVHLPDYNHLDFIWGINAVTDVYKPIANLIRESRQPSGKSRQLETSTTSG